MQILFQSFKKVLKDAEFYAESKSVEKVKKSQTKKKLQT